MIRLTGKKNCEILWRGKFWPKKNLSPVMGTHQNSLKYPKIWSEWEFFSKNIKIYSSSKNKNMHKKWQFSNIFLHHSFISISKSESQFLQFWILRRCQHTTLHRFRTTFGSSSFRSGLQRANFIQHRWKTGSVWCLSRWPRSWWLGRRNFFICSNFWRLRHNNTPLIILMNTNVNPDSLSIILNNVNIVSIAENIRI